MKKLTLALATIIGAFNLIGCQGTSNSSTPSSVASSCSVNAYGQSINTSTGAPCVSTSSYCGTSSYNPYGYNGCTAGTGTSGYGLGGCAYWSTVYPGTYYAPMIDPTSGQLECVNLSSYGMSGYPSGYNPYTASQPIYVVQCYDPSCGSGYSPYGNYGSYGYGGGGGTCLGAGSGDGSFFGLCF